MNWPAAGINRRTCLLPPVSVRRLPLSRGGLTQKAATKWPLWSCPNHGIEAPCKRPMLSRDAEKRREAGRHGDVATQRKHFSVFVCWFAAWA